MYSKNGTKNLTQQDIQTSSHFVSEEIVETITTTAQQSFSLIHPNLTSPKTKIPTIKQTAMQSTKKPAVAQKTQKRITKHFDQQQSHHINKDHHIKIISQSIIIICK